MTKISRKAALALAIAASAAPTSFAFTPQSFLVTRTGSSSSLSMSTVDPTVVTKKEYQDICGVDFDDKTLSDRLKKTAYLYPKHVEVIEDFAPLVEKMVDDIVSYLSNDMNLLGCLWIAILAITECDSNQRIYRGQIRPFASAIRASLYVMSAICTKGHS